LTGGWGFGVNGSGTNGRRQLGLAAIVGAFTIAVLLGGCSSDVTSSSPQTAFPAVHDMPAPRPEPPLSPEQVKQATDDLITERDHLNGTAHPQPAAAAKTGNADGKAAPTQRKKQTSTARSNATQTPESDPPVTAGAYAKP
jgi:hypothetical protein